MPEDASSQASETDPAKTVKYRRFDSDDALAAACLRGDKRAWEALIDRYQGFILSISIRRGLTRSDAEDVFQNVCVKLYEHLADLRDVRKLSGWIAAVTVRETQLIYRKDPLRLFSENISLNDDLETGEQMFVSPDDGPEEELLALERREVVRRMLDELSDECRSLLTKLYVADEPLSYNDVASALNMPLGSIGPKRARCLSKLRQLLEKIGYS